MSDEKKKKENKKLSVIEEAIDSLDPAYQEWKKATKEVLDELFTDPKKKKEDKK